MSDKIICEICGTRIAEYHFTKTNSGKSRDFHVCASCKNILDKELEKKAQEAFMRSLPENQRTCVCGSSLQNIRKCGFVGCAECYNTFAKYLDTVIFKYHNNTEHKGRNGKIRPLMDIEYLYLELKKAVDEERFEDASRLKKQIDEIRKDWEIE